MKKVILIIILLFITGCHSYNEPDKLAIISTIALDYYDNNYHLILEIEESANKGEISSYLAKSSAETIEKAFKKLDSSLSKALFFTSLDILIITPEIACNHLKEISYFLINEERFNFNFYIAATDNPEVIIDMANTKDQIFGSNTKQIFDKKDYQFKKTDMISFLNNYLDSNIITLPKINWEEDRIIINEELILRRM